MGAPPPPNVLRAFGVRADASLTPLAGGLEQSAWRVGDLVLKPVQSANAAEGEWVATVLDAIVEDGFRVIKPVRADDGRWLEGGWAAWHWIAGEHATGRWTDVFLAAEAFHRALGDAVSRAGVDPRPAWLHERRHRWAIAEGVVWRDEPLPTDAIYDVPEWELWQRARNAGPPLRADESRLSQVVHGDIASNVLVDPAGVPAFIDVSPGWRPPASAHAQIYVEAVCWHRGDESLVTRVDRADVARACAFRLMCGFQALTTGLRFNPNEVARFRRVLDVVHA